MDYNEHMDKETLTNKTHECFISKKEVTRGVEKRKEGGGREEEEGGKWYDKPQLYLLKVVPLCGEL